MSKTKTFSTSIDLSLKTRDKAIALCNQQLADTFDLYSQTKQAHWNVKGMDFIQLHDLFDKLAADLLAHADTIAERATALGGTALGTARMAAGESRLDEYPLAAIDGHQHVEALTERYASLAKSTRAAIDSADEMEDKVTADMFTQIGAELDKALWFLEAHLQADGNSKASSRSHSAAMR